MYYTGWIRPLIAAFGLVAIYSVPFLFTASGRDADTAFLFILVSTALFFVVNIFSMLVDSRKTPLGAVRYAHLIVALSTTVYLMIWIADAGVPEYRAFLYLAWMFVFALGSFVVYTRMHIRAPFYIYGAMSLALLAAATSEVFHGDTLVIAYTIEVAALTVVALLIDTRNTASGTPSSLVASVFWFWLIPIFLSLESIYSFSWREGVLHADCAVLLVLMLSSFVASMCISMRVQQISENAKHIGLILLLGSGMYALTLIWLVLHALLSADTATMFSLFVYSALGIALYVSGEIHEQKVRRYVGAVLLGGVIVRLLLVEVWSMPLAGRIITFFVIGLLLMSTAFIKRIKK